MSNKLKKLARFHSPRNNSNRRTWIRNLKIKASTLFNHYGRQIQCKHCGKLANFIIKKINFGTKNSRTVKWPEMFSPVSTAPRDAKTDILRDLYWLCNSCMFRKFEIDDEGYKILKNASEKGGDVFSLKPFYGGIWGNGK